MSRIGGVAGPLAFASAWVATGPSTPGYSPVRDAISRLAATDAPHRGWMTAGLMAFGVGVSTYGVAEMRRSVSGPAWMATVVGGLATVGVACTPLGPADDNPAHWAFAGVGYLGVALAPLLAAPRTRWSVAAGGVAAACLIATTVGDDLSGLFQRAGLSVAHAWILVSALKGRGTD